MVSRTATGVPSQQGREAGNNVEVNSAQEMGIAWAGVRFSHLAGLAGRCRAEAGGALERESKDEHASEHYL